MVQIAVLMACFNRKEKTLNCLHSLFNQQRLGREYSVKVYLVDDGSTDGTGIAVAASFPDVTIIKGDGKLFWNRSMHLAWEEAAGGNYNAYLWLNDDTYLYEGALAEMLYAAKQTKFGAIICGCTESPNKKGELTYGGGNHIGKTYISNYPDGTVSACDIINGNCVLVPQKVFEQVGNLDWRFNHGIGDNDYSLRAKKLGIISYTTSHFIGSCARHATLPKWCLPQVNLKNRLKNLYSPLGNPPNQYFVFERRHFGLVTAIKHYFSVHLRVIVPILWRYK